MSLDMVILQSVPSWVPGALVAFGIFLLSHLGIAIWFASGIKHQVAQLVVSQQGMATELSLLTKLDGRLQVIESRMARAEKDAADAIRAAAELRLHVKQ